MFTDVVDIDAWLYLHCYRKLSITTNRPDDACLLIASVESDDDVASLKYWNAGRNHVLLNIGKGSLANYPNAIVVSASFHPK
ncbi:unnamed protein product [Gongylonema pulchrum]|uniref:Wax2_C domain-containing protein n=1 Tax=Gongylonema pulchrum TaxID=637853 RepID=A0A183EM23_9BILA|nr:unnamed protein product [Gongylonema pulchrum]